MIEPDPKCAYCSGTGDVAHDGTPVGSGFAASIPCRCCWEPNECDRCATLQCGEARAPRSRWDGVPCPYLCKPCWAAIGRVQPASLMSPERKCEEIERLRVVVTDRDAEIERLLAVIDGVARAGQGGGMLVDFISREDGRLVRIMVCSPSSDAATLNEAVVRSINLLAATMGQRAIPDGDK